MVDEVRLDPYAAVRDRRIGGGELDGRDGDPLSDGDVADRRARPVGRQQALAFAREVDARAPAEPETRHPLLQAGLTEIPLGDRDRADIRGTLEDLRHRQPL